MKVLALVLFASVVAARPELRTKRSDNEAKEGRALESSASLPSGAKRTSRESDSYIEGAEIPVQLVYEEGDETEAVVQEVTDSKDPMLNRVAREPIRRRFQHFQTYSTRKQRSAINPLWAALTGSSWIRSRRSRRSIGQSALDAMYPGPRIVKLKVRRGGVAIAGPGGVATAGSGGTAIVGPGGTAYTTPDGTAVVGPGGRLIQLGTNYLNKGRSNARIIATGPVVYYPMQF